MASILTLRASPSGILTNNKVPKCICCHARPIRAGGRCQVPDMCEASTSASVEDAVEAMEAMEALEAMEAMEAMEALEVVDTVDVQNAMDVAPMATASISRLAMYNTRLTSTRSSLYQQSLGPASTATSASSSGLTVGTTTGSGGRGSLVSVLSSAALVGATVTTAVVATVRSKLKAVRQCSCCQGYGVERCKLCEGKGTIQWEGKMAHREPCPMCLGRRLVKCSACGGGLMFSRSLFTHKANKGEDAIMETLTTLTTSSRLFGRRPSSEQDDARIAASEEFSKEILTD